MQDLFATSFNVSTEDPDRAFGTVTAEISGWAWRGEGEAPDPLGEPQGTRTEGGRHLSWVLLSLPNRAERALQLELRHPDQRERGIEWRTIVDLCRGGDYLRLTLMNCARGYGVSARPRFARPETTRIDPLSP